MFDEKFNFERNLKDTLAYANIHKNGSLAQREQLDMLRQGSESNYQSRSMANELAQGVAEGLFQTTGNMLETVGKTIGSFFEIMMEPVNVAPEPDPSKRKKKEKERAVTGSIPWSAHVTADVVQYQIMEKLLSLRQ